MKRTKKEKTRRRVTMDVPGLGTVTVRTEGRTVEELSPRTRAALAKVSSSGTPTPPPKTRLCAAPGCLEEVPSDRVACKAHWYGLPAALRDSFYPAMPAAARLSVFDTVRNYLTTHPLRVWVCSGFKPAIIDDMPTDTCAECGLPRKPHG